MLAKIREIMNRRPVRESWQRYTLTNKVNVNEFERLVSIVSGGVLVIYGLSRFSFTGLGLAGVGGYLIYRGLTGHCLVYESTRFSTASRAEQLQFKSGRRPTPESRSAAAVENRVDQGVVGSFPASDPPAWTSSRL